VALTASNLATLKPLMRKLRVFKSMSSITHYGSKSQPVGGAGTAGHAPSRSKSFVNGNNHITITGAASARESRGVRWNRRESMELELVDKRDGTSSEGKSDVEKSRDSNGGEVPSWLNV